VAGLSWSELNRERATWNLPAERATNGEPSIIPLNALAMAILDGLAGCADEAERKWPPKGLIFTTTGKRPISGFSRAKARLDADMLALARKDAEAASDDPDDVTLAPWRLHDARRTLATALQRLGVRFEVTEAVLNHTSGASRTGVAAVYQRHDWAEEKRGALDAWGEHCRRLIDGAGSAENVVLLRAMGK
jgi:hypothetical protein